MVNKKRELNEFFQLHWFYLNFAMFCPICVYWFHVYFNVRIIHHLVFRYNTKMVLASLAILILKTWRAPAIRQFNIFLWNFIHIFYLLLSTKGLWNSFLFYLDPELFAKIKKDLLSTRLFFYTFIETHNLNKVKIPYTIL